MANSIGIKPITIPPKASLQETQAPVYISGMPLDALVASVKNNRYYLFSQMGQNQDQFWSSGLRVAQTDQLEGLDIAFDTPRLINRLSFDVSRFPHEMAVFYKPTLDSSDTNWQPLLTSGNLAIHDRVTDSIPSVITPMPYGSNVHPLHHGAGHWITRSYNLAPTVVGKLRILLRRLDVDAVPRNTSKVAVPYSLAVRGMQVGYAITQRSDVPKTDRSLSTLSERQAFSTTTDILGSSVTLSVRENRASDLLNGGVWKSEPQPIPDAVVNLYVDARDSAGQPQVVDKFRISTQTSGVACNLYYSNDDASVHDDFPASEGPLQYPVIWGMGTFTADHNGLDFPAASMGGINIRNESVQFDPGKPFTVGIQFSTHFTTDSVQRPLFGVADFGISINNGVLQVQMGSTVLADYAPQWTANQSVSVVVWLDSNNTLSMYNTITRTTVSTSVVPTTAYRRTISIGGDVGLGTSCGCRIMSLFVKQAEPTGNTDEYDEFGYHPTAYVKGESFVDNANPDGNLDNTSDNIILRYLPDYQSYSTQGGSSLATQSQSVVNPYGFLGGPANRFEDLVWTPIAHSYRLQEGFLQFDPVLAKYFKFEMTNLVAQHYDDYFVQSRVVKMFPEGVAVSDAPKVGRNNTQQSATSVRPTTPLGNPLDTAVSHAQAAAPSRNYSDQATNLVLRAPLHPIKGYAPTAAVVSSHPDVAAKVRATTVTYNSLKPWHPSPSVPRFAATQVHVYETVNVAHTNKVAYFAGLTRLEMYRVNYTAADDTGLYVEQFFDTQHISGGYKNDLVGVSAFSGAHPSSAVDINAMNGWSVDTVNGGLISPIVNDSTTSSSVRSVAFNSTRRVTGIQFAAQQAAPIQLLDDPELSDSSLANWTSVGDATITADVSDAAKTTGMAKVVRNSGLSYWSIIEQQYPYWANFTQDANGNPITVTWGDLSSSGVSESPMGGIQTVNNYPVPSRGRIYAAARVYADAPLTSPLYVQITNGNGLVLAEDEIAPQAGQVAEWWTSFDLGTYNNPSPATWASVEQQGTWGDVEGATSGTTNSWGAVQGSVGYFTGNVGVQIVQMSPSMDSWQVDNLSLFEDSIVWDFSRDGGNTWYQAIDVRNNPDAVLTFPPLSSNQDGHSLVWRVTSARSNQRIHSLAIRPHYDTLPMGRPSPNTMSLGGPTLSKTDLYPEIHMDPRWTPGFTPIPRDWFIAFRTWLERTQGIGSDQTTASDSSTSTTTPQAPTAILHSTRQATYTDLSGNQVALPAPVDGYQAVGQPEIVSMSDGSLAVATVLVDNTVAKTNTTLIRVWIVESDTLSIRSSYDYDPTVLNPNLAVGQPVIFTIEPLPNNRLSIVVNGMEQASSGGGTTTGTSDSGGGLPVTV